MSVGYAPAHHCITGRKIFAGMMDDGFFQFRVQELSVLHILKVPFLM
jgi:hypothetical protein